MRFRTEIELRREAPFRLNTESSALLLGSCFSANIGEKMSAGWTGKVVANPCGVVYNPATIGLLIQLALLHRPQRRMIAGQSLTEREGKWVSWFMDSKTSGATPEECVDAIMERLDVLENALETSEVMLVTFGTPWVWLLKDTDRAVGNCHKHPDSEFIKKRLGISEIVSLWKDLIGGIRERNEGLKIIFTVSPVRYLGEGFAENSRLKSVLLLACEELTRTVKDCDYFPAFEILNDDLRDYRFYAEDLRHPSKQAVEYTWEKFCGHYLDNKELEKVRKRERESLRLSHKQIL